MWFFWSTAWVDLFLVHQEHSHALFFHLFVSPSLKKKLKLQSRLEVFCKKYVLKNLTKFTGKHLCQSLFFNKVAGLRLVRICT